MRDADNLTYVKCGKCGEVKAIVRIVCLVDDVPYCEDCFLKALGIEESAEVQNRDPNP